MMLRAALVLLLTCLVASGAHAERRVALVIGNSAYSKVGKLPNAGRDAEAVEKLFRTAGFDVVEAKRDLGVAGMRRALRDFSDQVRDADIAVVFYAGHGIEVNGTNYLVPIDSLLERDIDVEDEAVPLDRVVRILEQAKRLRLVILDACRDSPFVRTMKRTFTGRAIGRGLAKVEDLTSDTLIAFAAKAGSTAADGDGANSPYTSALVKHLAAPGLDLRLALGRVRDEVLKTTSNKQEPFVYGSLGGAEISLVPAAKPQSGPQQASQSPGEAQALSLRLPASEAAQAWMVVKDDTNLAALEAFIAYYPNSYYSDLARLRIDELLKRPQVAVAAPPPAAVPKADPRPQRAAAVGPQEGTCSFYKVDVGLLTVSKDPGGAIYTDVLEDGEIACVIRQQKVDGGDWGYVSHKLAKPSGHKPVNGWSMLHSMKELSQVEAAALLIAAVPAPGQAAVARPEDILRFDQPIPYGPYPVNSRSIEELAAGVPLFPPIDGLDDALWKKTCTTCHQWDKARLCEQGKTYVKAPKAILRHPHPYGGAYKTALMRWAKSGCQ